MFCYGCGSFRLMLPRNEFVRKEPSWLKLMCICNRYQSIAGFCFIYHKQWTHYFKHFRLWQMSNRFYVWNAHDTFANTAIEFICLSSLVSFLKLVNAYLCIYVLSLLRDSHIHQYYILYTVYSIYWAFVTYHVQVRTDLPSEHSILLPEVFSNNKRLRYLFSVFFSRAHS